MLLAEPSRPVNLVCPVGSDLPLPASVRPVHSSGSGSAIVTTETENGRGGNWEDVTNVIWDAMHQAGHQIIT